MKSLRVTVVPVGLRPVADGPQLEQLRASTLRPGGAWLSAEVSEPATVLEVARRLLDEAVDPEMRAAVRLENVGVDYASGTPNLLLTAVLPIAAAELHKAADDWPLLMPWVGDDSVTEHPQLLHPDPVRGALIAHWREQLMRTTAVFDFLPKFFTMYQARSVFASMWGQRQSGGNFQRWLGSAVDVEGDQVCAEVGEDQVRRETQADFAQRLASATQGMSAAMVEQQWDPRIIGTSIDVAGLPGIASLVPVTQVVGAITGATVGHQRARSVGRPPRWFSRTVDQRVDLKPRYSVEPPAVWRPPVFVD